jgi:TetR/AcrR family transcriptional regulator, regulator of biofilm formation and stress response
MGRPATLTAKGQRRREALLHAAAALIAEKGYSGVTHRAVAERAGVPLASTSYFFASIDDLVREAALHFQQRRTKEFEVALHGLPGSITPAEGARAIADLVFSLPLEQPISNYEIYLNASRTRELREVAADSVMRLDSVAEAALRSLGATHPEDGARALVALCDGFVLRRIAHPEPDDRAALERALRTLLVALVMDDAERAEWDRRLAASPEPAGT